MPILEEAEEDLIFTGIAVLLIAYVLYKLIHDWIPAVDDTTKETTGAAVRNALGYQPTPGTTAAQIKAGDYATGQATWDAIWNDIGIGY